GSRASDRRAESGRKEIRIQDLSGSARRPHVQPHRYIDRETVAARSLRIPGEVPEMIVIAALAVYLAGNPGDVHVKLHGPILDLAGSSAEPSGLQAMVDAVRGCTTCDAKLDVVIIRASGDQGLNPVFMELHGVDSAQSYVITDRDSANRRDVEHAVRYAEIIWFAGGDQCNYIRWVK